MTQSEILGPKEMHPPAYFAEALNDGERLLKYAAEIGVEVDPGTRDAVLHARTAYSHGGWNDQIAADFLAALTRLASHLKPVTAESLKAYREETRPTVRTYVIWALVLAAIILPVSVATFVTSSISSALRDDITNANALAVRLQVELGNPSGQAGADAIPKQVGEKDLVADLQQYASLVRTINARARKLNHFVIPAEARPVEDQYPDTADGREKRKEQFELPVPLTDPIAARDTLTKTYQDVRYFALSLLTDVSVFYGAISSCILPVLYALLGTCAYLIRTFEHQMNSRTFTPSAANSARFLIAAIGGLVVGLFNNVSITAGASLSPLALAFLVGYAVDVFFSFLEGLLKAFTRSPSAPTPPPPHSPTVSGTH